MSQRHPSLLWQFQTYVVFMQPVSRAPYVIWDVLAGVQIEKLRDNAHTWMRRDLCLGSHGSRNVSDSCHRLSCSARLKRADVDRVSRDISVPLWFRHRFLMYQINSLGQNPIFQSLVSIVKNKIKNQWPILGISKCHFLDVAFTSRSLIFGKRHSHSIRICIPRNDSRYHEALIGRFLEIIVEHTVTWDNSL